MKRATDLVARRSAKAAYRNNALAFVDGILLTNDEASFDRVLGLGLGLEQLGGQHARDVGHELARLHGSYRL